MNLSKNEELKEILKTFAVMNKDGILSTDEDITTEDETSDEGSDADDLKLRPNLTNTGISYSIPKLSISNTSNTKSQYYENHSAEYLNFTNENPTTYHVIEYFKTILQENGFVYLPEGKPIDKETLLKGGLFFTIRGGLSLVSFILGNKWEPKNGISGVGSHVDSLTVKLKPISEKANLDGYKLLGVAPYSGTLNKLWVDRDLGIGGCILIRDEKSGKIIRKLVSSSPHPIAKIPSLAEHFGAVADKRYNSETEMVPIIGYSNDDDESEPLTDDEKNSPLIKKHSIDLLRYVSKILGYPMSSIIQLDLELFDVQQAARGGINNEFIFAPRVDDRLCSFSAIKSLIETSKAIDFENYDGFHAVYLTDNEEIGSATRTGAKGKLLNSVVDKIIDIKNSPPSENLRLVFANSVILSADVTHALNPNFKSAYLKDHYPLLNTGLTIKIDPNGHVMTDSIGVTLIEEIANKNKLKLQKFHIRNDGRSGSTIGPMLAVDTGARIIDVGLPQLAMHSIRGTTGYKEAGLGVEIFNAFHKDWRKVYDNIDYS